MRRNFTIDILLMSLFLIFGGAGVNGQKVLKPKKGSNPTVFGPIGKLGDGGDDVCISSENGQYCFSTYVHFINLEYEIRQNRNGEYFKEAIFPCDLYAGLTIGGLETIYTSLSTEVTYNNIPPSDITDFHQLAYIDLGCYDYQIIQDLWPDIHCSGDNFYYTIPFSLDLYCLESDEFKKVDFHEDYDDFKNIVYENDEIDSNESLGFEGSIKFCCKTLDLDTDSSISTRKISYSNSQIIIEGSNIENLQYDIFDLSGIKRATGQFTDHDSYKQVIDNQFLENGFYIIVLTGKDYRISRKFTVFR